MKRFTPLLVIALATAGCDYVSDTVTDRYATLADARADRLFERGWLPNVLPASTIDIQTVNNLDTNTSTGQFLFAPSDGPAFLTKLTAGVPMESRFAHWPRTVAKYIEQGFTPWRYRDEDTTWVFFCLPAAGKCEYFAWLR